MNRVLMMLTAFVIVGALVTSCGSSKKTTAKTTASTAPPIASVALTTPDLTGTWSGQGGPQGRETPVALRLVQNGSALEGDVYVSGRDDLSGPIKGTVEGNTVRLALGIGLRQTSALQISPDGNQISGSMVGSPLVLMRSR
jgi:hypothetical protein